MPAETVAGRSLPVDVLLATYRADPVWLKAQVDSIRAQEGVEVNLLCREDEAGAGAKVNFSALLAQSTADYVALSDQDDVWLPAKLSASLSKLQVMEREFGRETPLCVFCDSRLVDGELKDLGRTNVEAQGVDVAAGLRFNRLLMQNFIPGHSMIFNAALRRKAGTVPPGAMMHDVWLALVAAAFGRIGYVNEPLALYRQHGRNALGAVGGSRSVAGFRERLAGNERQARAFVERFGAAAPAAARALSDFSSRGWFARRFTLVRHRLWKHGWRRNVALLLFA